MKKHGVEKNHTHVKQHLCLFSFILFCCIIILLYFLCILIFFFLFQVVVRIDLFVYIFCYVLNTRKLCLFDVRNIIYMFLYMFCGMFKSF